MVRTCSKCKSTMHKIRRINSSNAIYETWQCDKCNFREELCIGIK